MGHPESFPDLAHGGNPGKGCRCYVHIVFLQPAYKKTAGFPKPS